MRFEYNTAQLKEMPEDSGICHPTDYDEEDENELSPDDLIFIFVLILLALIAADLAHLYTI